MNNARKISALVEDMETWDGDNLLGWAMSTRRNMLENASPEEVNSEYEALAEEEYT